MTMKSKIMIFFAILIALSGYFTSNTYFLENEIINQLIQILSLVVSGIILMLTDQGKKFLSFFADVKSESKKIFFPTMKETLNGLGVVFCFCTSFLVIIWLMDSVFTRLYQILM